MVSNRAKKLRTVEDVDQLQHDDDVFLAMEKLQEVQDELEKINEEANEKILAIEQKYNEEREPVYVRRNEIISSIPDFWLTAFLNHPTLGIMLTDEDQKIFGYLDSLIVNDFKDPRKGYCITFNFKANPYFENKKLTRTINFSDEGTLKSVGTTIKWKEGMGPTDGHNNEKKGNKRPILLDSFFTWFEPEVDQDLVAEMIKEDLWPNPIEHLNNEDDDEQFDDDEDDEDEENDNDEAEAEEDDKTDA